MAAGAGNSGAAVGRVMARTVGVEKAMRFAIAAHDRAELEGDFIFLHPAQNPAANGGFAGAL